jgi:hypothetical protein
MKLGRAPNRLALAPRAALSLSSAEGSALLALHSDRLDIAVWSRAWIRRGNDGQASPPPTRCLKMGTVCSSTPTVWQCLMLRPTNPLAPLS